MKRNRIKIVIDTDNAAFHEVSPMAEVKRILFELAKRCDQICMTTPNHKTTLYDINGNAVGEMTVN